SEHQFHFDLKYRYSFSYSSCDSHIDVITTPSLLPNLPGVALNFVSEPILTSTFSLRLRSSSITSPTSKVSNSFTVTTAAPSSTSIVRTADFTFSLNCANFSGSGGESDSNRRCWLILDSTGSIVLNGIQILKLSVTSLKS